MKRIIVYFVVALCAAAVARADQATQSVQQALKDQGFYYGNVTGEKSAETTAAIRRYQIRSGLQVTGEINPETLQSLKPGSNSSSASSSQLAPKPSQPTSKPAVAQSNNARPAETPQLDQDSSPQPPPTAPDRQLDTNQTFPYALYQSAPPRMKGRMVVAEVQRQLMSRGYYRGRIDGRYRGRTTFALREFQLQSGLPPTGRLDTSTLGALGLSVDNLASSQAAPRQDETWVPITKFKHGKWKVKWKKYHGGGGDEYGDVQREQNADASWHGGDNDY